MPEQRQNRRGNVMLVENHVGWNRRRRQIVLARRPIGSQLCGMIVAMINIGVRMQVSARKAGRNHCHKQH